MRDLDAATIADHALVLHAAILAAGAFPVFFRAKDALAEQPVTLGAIGAIVDRFRLFHFAERPATNIVRPSEADFHSRVVVNAIVGRFADAHWDSFVEETILPWAMLRIMFEWKAAIFDSTHE